MAVSKERSPFTPGRPVPVEYFVGRAKEIEIINRALRQAATGRNENLFITGERTIGKSSLAAIARLIAQQDFQAVSAHCYLGSVRSLDEICRVIYEKLLEEMPTSSLREKAKGVLGKYVKSLNVGFLGIVSVEFTREQSELSELRLAFVSTLIRLWEALHSEARVLLLVLDDLNGATAIPEFAHFLKSVVDELASARAKAGIPLVLILVGVQERMDDFARHQPSLPRIFTPIELPLMTSEETAQFFSKTFNGVGATVEEKALKDLVHYSGGLPAVAHEIGDAVYWADSDNRIELTDALLGVLGAAEAVGRKYLSPRVSEALRSQTYRNLLAKISREAGPTVLLGEEGEIRRDKLSPALSPQERRNLGNFLRRMEQLGVLKKGEERGAYDFVTKLSAIYFYLEALKADQEAKQKKRR